MKGSRRSRNVWRINLVDPSRDTTRRKIQMHISLTTYKLISYLNVGKIRIKKLQIGVPFANEYRVYQKLENSPFIKDINSPEGKWKWRASIKVHRTRLTSLASKIHFFLKISFFFSQRHLWYTLYKKKKQLSFNHLRFPISCLSIFPRPYLILRTIGKLYHF